MKTYLVEVIREEGYNPLTETYTIREEESLVIEAESDFRAFKKSHLMSKIQFQGQIRKTFINGVEYFDPEH